MTTPQEDPTILTTEKFLWLMALIFFLFSSEAVAYTDYPVAVVLFGCGLCLLARYLKEKP